MNSEPIDSVETIAPPSPPDTPAAPGVPDRPDLVADIDPVPVKQRAPLGVVELALDEGQSVRAVGLVYGIEHRISGEGFEATVFLDQYNQRLRVYGYRATDYDALILKLRWLAEANGFDKILCMASPCDWERFLRHGYVLEAILKYYHRGEDALVMSKFRSQERLTSPNLMQEILLIEELLARDVPPAPDGPPDGYRVRMARPDDVGALIDLFRTIFKTYPTPLIHRAYLEHVFQTESLFAVCEREGAVVAAASAELHAEARAAELTDCATRSDARGRGLMSALLRLLEGELRRRDFVCAYTMARARSFGMNAVFRGLGYEFNGRLVNNCDIFGAYEDMNIWVRDLRVPAPAAPPAD
jgi:putative beta-lysine N-acetyltransferase